MRGRDAGRWRYLQVSGVFIYTVVGAGESGSHNPSKSKSKCEKNIIRIKDTYSFEQKSN